MCKKVGFIKLIDNWDQTLGHDKRKVFFLFALSSCLHLYCQAMIYGDPVQLAKLIHLQFLVLNLKLNWFHFSSFRWCLCYAFCGITSFCS